MLGKKLSGYQCKHFFLNHMATVEIKALNTIVSKNKHGQQITCKLQAQP